MTLATARRTLLVSQKDWKNPKVYLKPMPAPKTTGIVAAKNSKRGETIAYYPIVLLQDPGANPSKRKFPLQDYFIEVKYRGKSSKQFIGQPDLRKAIQKPTRSIPHIGLWSNEPYPREKSNAAMEYKSLTKPARVGGKLSYSLKATRGIKKGEEVLWCYGTEFNRGTPPYKTGCSWCPYKRKGYVSTFPFSRPPYGPHRDPPI